MPNFARPLTDTRHGECRWPVYGDPKAGTMLVCCERTYGSSSYCEAHWRKSVAPYQPRVSGLSTVDPSVRRVSLICEEPAEIRFEAGDNS